MRRDSFTVDGLDLLSYNRPEEPRPCDGMNFHVPCLMGAIAFSQESRKHLCLGHLIEEIGGQVRDTIEQIEQDHAVTLEELHRELEEAKERRYDDA